MGKMIKGEPVFDASSNSKSDIGAEAASNSVGADPTRTSNGHKVVPQIRIGKVQAARNGGKMQAHAWIQNDSQLELEITHITTMGQKYTINQRLSTRQGRQIKVYDGPIGIKEHEEAYVDYKIVQNGDYFQQEFMVELHRQGDGMYLLEEFHREDHTRDT